MTLKHVFVGALLSACATTEARPANVLDGLEAPAGPAGFLLVHDYLPGSSGRHDRLRIDGSDVIWELETGWEYAEFFGRGYSIGVLLPVGEHQIEIVDPDGQVLGSAQATIVAKPGDEGTRLATSVFVWGATEAWQPPPVNEVDPWSIRVAIRSLLSEPLEVLLCDTPDACSTVGTVPPNGTFEQTLPISDGSLRGQRVGDPSSSAYLGVLQRVQNNCLTNDTFVPEIINNTIVTAQACH